MKYRKLGNTGLDVSVLSFGASSLGSVFRHTDDMDSRRAVHAALHAGINYIDVSPYYGRTKAESVLGQALKGLPRDSYLLSTKVGRYGENEFDFSKDRVLRSLDESLTRLHTDYVDMLFLHDIEFVPKEIILEEAVPVLQRLKAEGKIRYFGFSGLPLKLFTTMLPLMEADVILSYCHYSLNDTSLLQLLPLAKEKQASLVNASPLSMGLLSTRETPSWHPASGRVKRFCKQAADYCASQGADIAKLAVQFSCSHEQIPTTLVSTANPDNIIRNAAWTDEAIDQELLASVLQILSPIRNELWPSGRPEYNEEPSLVEGDTL